MSKDQILKDQIKIVQGWWYVACKALNWAIAKKSSYISLKALGLQCKLIDKIVSDSYYVWSKV